MGGQKYSCSKSYILIVFVNMKENNFKLKEKKCKKEHLKESFNIP